MSTKKTRNASEALKALGAEPTTFGVLLKTYRQSEELTLLEMAKRLRISVSHLSDIENERKFVSLGRAKEFAARLHDSEKYFVLVAIRDLLRRADCQYEVDLKAI